MRITAGIFTFNIIKYQRADLLKASLQSLRAEADRIILIDNGSTDGTAAIVEQLGGVSVSYGDKINTCGRGMNTTLSLIGNYGDTDILVCSNDDIIWRPGWADRLRRVWSSAPQEMVLITGFLQPIYEWDKPLAVLNLYGEMVVERTSATGGAWTLRRTSLPLIGRISEQRGVDDVPKAKDLRSKGYRVGAIDLADHAGQDHSTWQKWSAGGDIAKWLDKSSQEKAEKRLWLSGEIQRSRERILASFNNAPDVTFIRTYGNIGDELILVGTRELLRDVKYFERDIRNLGKQRGHTALICGCGGWCRSHCNIPRFLPTVEALYERVIVLPSSFDINVKAVRDCLTNSKATFFARELASYGQIKTLCRAEITLDAAFFFDFSPYLREGSGELRAFRTDAETALGKVPCNNIDISLTCRNLHEWLQTIASHQRIYTDRAHVTIAAALLEKEVNYAPSNYHKIQGIVEYGLQGHSVYPITIEKST